MEKALAIACVEAITAHPYGYATETLVRVFEGLTPAEANDVLCHLGRWIEKRAGGEWPECPELDAAISAGVA